MSDERKKQRRRQQHWRTEEEKEEKEGSSSILLLQADLDHISGRALREVANEIGRGFLINTTHPREALLCVSENERISSNAFSLSTKREIQKSISIFAPLRNFFTERFHNHHHSGRHSHAPTMRRCRVL